MPLQSFQKFPHSPLHLHQLLFPSFLPLLQVPLYLRCLRILSFPHPHPFLQIPPPLHCFLTMQKILLLWNFLSLPFLLLLQHPHSPQAAPSLWNLPSLRVHPSLWILQFLPTLPLRRLPLSPQALLPAAWNLPAVFPQEILPAHSKAPGCWCYRIPLILRLPAVRTGYHFLPEIQKAVPWSPGIALPHPTTKYHIRRALHTLHYDIFHLKPPDMSSSSLP